MYTRRRDILLHISLNYFSQYFTRRKCHKKKKKQKEKTDELIVCSQSLRGKDEMKQKEKKESI